MRAADSCVMDCSGPCPPVHTEGDQVEVVLCGDGPALIRGAEAVYDLQGNRHVPNRPVVGVCLCGRSQREPWCDGTHKFLRRRKDRPALAGACAAPPRGPGEGSPPERPGDLGR